MKFGECRAIYEKQIPTLEIKEEEIMGKYRGAPWYSRRLTTPSRQKPWRDRLPLKSAQLSTKFPH